MPYLAVSRAVCSMLSVAAGLRLGVVLLHSWSEQVLLCPSIELKFAPYGALIGWHCPAVSQPEPCTATAQLCSSLCGARLCDSCPHWPVIGTRAFKQWRVYPSYACRST